jgi:protein-disulfide isomerase
LLGEPRNAGPGALSASSISPERIVQFVRERFEVPESVSLTAGPVHDSAMFPGFYETAVTSDDGKQKRTSVALITKDGRYFIMGSIFHLGADRNAEILKNVREATKLPPTTELSLGPITKSPYPEFLKSTLTATNGTNKQTAVMYLTKDSHIGIFGNVLPFQAGLEHTIVTRNQPAAGAANPRVTIVEYADLECPTCARFHEFLEKQFLPKYSDKVRVVFKEFPLPMHDWSMTAAIANECAYQIEPSTFVNYRSLIFASQAVINAANVREQMLSLGEQAGLDRVKLAACIDSKASLERVEAGRQEGDRLGVNKTPTSFVNGRVVVGMPTADSFNKIVDEALANAPAERKTRAAVRSR